LKKLNIVSGGGLRANAGGAGDEKTCEYFTRAAIRSRFAR
jgi:hypothetical protein